ncbi:MAG: TonB-dependent receptor, partial [Bacteroidota bacterium]
YNNGDDYAWIRAPITNEGIGRSYGIELTIEKPFSNKLYFLSTGSLYTSQYKGSNDIYRNTAFNGNYIFNIIFEREFTIDVIRNNYISLNLSTTGAGGRRYTPEVGNGNIAPDDSRAFELKYKDYFRTDLKLTLHQNFTKISQEISLDIRNIFNRKNVFERFYDDNIRSFSYVYQPGVLPLISYEINF